MKPLELLNWSPIGSHFPHSVPNDNVEISWAF